MSDVTVLIVDDEPAARNGLRRLLGAEAGIRVIGEARSGGEAVERIGALRPDVVFLDIQMPELNGFEVIDAVRDVHLPVVVFVTAYDAWAVRAFEVQALDYILKPFEDTRLQEVVRRVREHVAARGAGTADAGELLGRVRALLAERDSTATWVERLPVREAGAVRFIDLAEVDWIEAADYYARLHTGARTQLVRYTLNELERQLDPTRFVRVHRSAIVKVAAVREIRIAHQKHHSVVLHGGATVPLSRSKKEVLESALLRAR